MNGRTSKDAPSRFACGCSRSFGPTCTQFGGVGSSVDRPESSYPSFKRRALSLRSDGRARARVCDGCISRSAGEGELRGRIENTGRAATHVDLEAARNWVWAVCPQDAGIHTWNDKIDAEALAHSSFGRGRRSAIENSWIESGGC